MLNKEIFQIKNGLVLFLASTLIFIGLVFSRALLSIGSVLLLLHLFYPEYRRSFGQKQWLLLAPFGLYFGLHVLSFAYTEHPKKLLDDLFLKLPFVLIPLSLVNLKIAQKYFFYLHLLFQAIVHTVALLTFVNYLQNFEALNQDLLASKAIPIVSGVSHIYFGFMMTYAVLSSWYFWRFSPKNVGKGIRLWMFGMGMVNFLLLNLIAARTGLLSFYGSAFFFLLYQAFQQKQKKLLWATLLGLPLAFCLMVLLLPPLQKRAINTYADLSTYQEKKSDANDWSISLRFVAWETTWKVFEQSPIWGVGPADLRVEMNKVYEEDFPFITDYNKKNPHNQYLQTLGGLGLIGFSSLLYLLWVMLQSAHHQKNHLLLIVGLVLMLSMLFESIIERQVGIVFFSYFLGLCCAQVTNETNEN